MSESRGPRPKGRPRASIPARKHRATQASRGESPVRPRTDKPSPAAGSRRHRSRVRPAAARMRSKDRSITSRKANASETGRPAPSPASRIERRRAVSRRRAKLVGVACLGLCALVLATSFPVSALMRQHRQISTATAELQALTSENESLQLQASRAVSASEHRSAREAGLQPGPPRPDCLFDPPAGRLTQVLAGFVGSQLTRPGARGSRLCAVRGPPR